MTDIWDQWTKHYDQLHIDPARICKDGIIDEHLFGQAKRRILFIMKEVNGFPGGDLREMLKNGPKYQMWHATARWAAGLLNDFPPYGQINTIKVRHESLKSVATINLKKTSGKAQADMAVVNSYAHQDKELLRHQISDIRANVIVACGTFDILTWLLGLEVDCDDPRRKAVKHDEMFVIPWRHPGRVTNRETYEKLGELWSEVINDGR